MRRIIIIIFVALFGLSCFMVGRKILEYSNVKEEVIYYEESQQLDKELEKVNSDIETMKDTKKDELERLEKWQNMLKEIKETL